VPAIVTAYGTATPGPGSTSTISLPRAGQVQSLSAEPGVPVHAGDALLTFAAAPTAVQAYQQAVAALDLAKKERAHTAELLAQQLATRSQLAQADKAVADAEATLTAQRRENGGDPVQVVKAPFEGTVTSVAVKPGERVASAAPLLTLARSNGIVVSAGVEPSERPKLRPGEPAKLELLQGGGAVEGTVRQVSAMPDPATRQIGVKIGIPPGSVLPGAGFRVLITVGTFEGWPVPRDAVLSDGKGAYVFQVADATAHRVDVRIVGTFGETTVIDGPLEASRPVVTQGNYQLTDGEAVRVAQGGDA
jgi:membrane fusion protein, multidrug efflux system